MGACSGKSKRDDRDRTPYGQPGKNASNSSPTAFCEGEGDEPTSHRQQGKQQQLETAAAKGNVIAVMTSASEVNEEKREKNLSMEKECAIAVSQNVWTLAAPTTGQKTSFNAHSGMQEKQEKPVISERQSSASSPQRSEDVKFAFQTPARQAGVKNIASPSFANATSLSPQGKVAYTDAMKLLPSGEDCLTANEADIKQTRLNFSAEQAPLSIKIDEKDNSLKSEPTDAYAVTVRPPMRTFGSMRDTKLQSPSHSQPSPTNNSNTVTAGATTKLILTDTDSLSPKSTQNSSAVTTSLNVSVSPRSHPSQTISRTELQSFNAAMTSTSPQEHLSFVDNVLAVGNGKETLKNNLGDDDNVRINNISIISNNADIKSSGVGVKSNNANFMPNTVNVKTEDIGVTLNDFYEKPNNANVKTIEVINKQANIVEPVHYAIKPVDNGVKPVDNGIKSVDNGIKPVDNGVKSVDSGVKSVDNGVKPIDNDVKPTIINGRDRDRNDESKNIPISLTLDKLQQNEIPRNGTSNGRKQTTEETVTPSITSENKKLSLGETLTATLLPQTSTPVMTTNGHAVPTTLTAANNRASHITTTTPQSSTSSTVLAVAMNSVASSPTNGSLQSSIASNAHSLITDSPSANVPTTKAQEKAAALKFSSVAAGPSLISSAQLIKQEPITDQQSILSVTLAQQLNSSTVTSVKPFIEPLKEVVAAKTSSQQSATQSLTDDATKAASVTNKQSIAQPLAENATKVVNETNKQSVVQPIQPIADDITKMVSEINKLTNFALGQTHQQNTPLTPSLSFKNSLKLDQSTTASYTTGNGLKDAGKESDDELLDETLEPLHVSEDSPRSDEQQKINGNQVKLSNELPTPLTLLPDDVATVIDQTSVRKTEAETPQTTKIDALRSKLAVIKLPPSLDRLPDFSKSNKALCDKRPFQNGSRLKTMQMIEKWWNRNADSNMIQSRTMVVFGRAAVGKTSLAVEIGRRYSENILCYHYFNFCPSKLHHNSARRATLWLARQLAAKFQDVYQKLISVNDGDDFEEFLRTKSLSELFNRLIVLPLSSPDLNQLLQGKNSLIIISGLDHCQRDSDWQIFLDSLSILSKCTSQWLFILITCLDDSRILEKFSNVEQIDMANSISLSENQADVKRCLRDGLNRFIDRISLDGGLSQLATKSEGNLLCARIMANSLNGTPERKVALREVDSLFPAGLTRILQRYLDNFKTAIRAKQSDNDLAILYSNCMGVLVMCQEPVHESFVTYLTKMQKIDIVSHLDHIIHVDSDKCISLLHSRLRDWFIDEKEAGEFAINLPQAKQKMADLCAEWLEAGRKEKDRSKRSCHELLYNYALKYAMFHFLEASKQQERVAEMLCSLRTLQDKLNLDEVSLHSLLDDYKHEHEATAVTRKVSIFDYMAKQPKMWEQVKTYERLLNRKSSDILHDPHSFIQLAANYTGSQRIQHNARAEVSELQWIEDTVIAPEANCMIHDIGYTIIDIDTSFDEKLLAMAVKNCDTNQTVALHVYSVTNFERKILFQDLNTIRDQLGPLVRFLPDGNIFVGSLASVITLAGRTNATGFDLATINMAEKYNIECASVSTKYLACGITTIPSGGRSVHLIVVDLKSKRCTQCIELLKFKFGGSALFGVRCLAISSDESLLCAAFKNTTKSVLKATIWSTNKWSQIATVDLDTDLITRCYFIEPFTVSFSCGLRAGGVNYKQMQTVRNQKILRWYIEDIRKPATIISPAEENHGLVSLSRDGKVYSVCWKTSQSNAFVYVRKYSDDKEINNKCLGNIPELNDVSEVVFVKSNVFFVSGQHVLEYNISDLQETIIDDAEATPSLLSIRCINCCFVPKSDTVLVCHRPNDDIDSISALFVEIKQDEEPYVTMLPFDNEPCHLLAERQQLREKRKFLEHVRPDDVCTTNYDGNMVIFNSGTVVKVWNKSDDSVQNLPITFHDNDASKSAVTAATFSLFCLPSAKENIVGILSGHDATHLHILDLKSLSTVATIACPRGVSFTDFNFMPHNGCLLTFSAASNELTSWNYRQMVVVNSSVECLAYCKCSPATDRFVMSLYGSHDSSSDDNNDDNGEVVLRNSDGKFRLKLITGGGWLGNSKRSDVAFSVDGTVLVGVCRKSSVCRVWNAANGEVLRDLNVTLSRNFAQIIGLITNTHLAFYDGRIVVVDVSSGHLITSLPVSNSDIDVDDTNKRNFTNFAVSLRSPLLAGWRGTNEKFLLYVCHNFEAIKRKTTLQRMKSFIQ